MYKRGLAISQIFILIFGIVSFSILLSEIVSAEDKPTSSGKEGDLSPQKEWIFKNGLWGKNEDTTALNSKTPSSTPIPAYKNIYGFDEAATADVTPDAASKM